MAIWEPSARSVVFASRLRQHTRALLPRRQRACVLVIFIWTRFAPRAEIMELDETPRAGIASGRIVQAAGPLGALCAIFFLFVIFVNLAI
jgi:hypothetical protein